MKDLFARVRHVKAGKIPPLRAADTDAAKEWLGILQEPFQKFVNVFRGPGRRAKARRRPKRAGPTI